MHRGTKWLVWTLILLIVGLAGWFIARSTTGLPTVRLPGGGTIEIMAVAVNSNSICSSEEGFQHVARKACPDLLEPILFDVEPLVHQTMSREGLLVWVRLHSPDGRQSLDDLDRPRAALPDGAVARGLLGARRNHTMCLAFPVFPRDAAKIRLTLWDGTGDVSFDVPNAKVSTMAPWAGIKPSLPQTNRTAHSDVVLQSISTERSAERAVRLRVNSRDTAPAGWVEWRVAFIDPLGNWMPLTPTGWSVRSSRPTAFPLPTAPKIWRLEAEGREYISAGLVSPLTNGLGQWLPVNERARSYGVRGLWAVGRGSYTIEQEVLTTKRDAGSDTDALSRSVAQLKVESGGGQERWRGGVHALSPGLICLAVLGPNDLFVTARLRERGKNGENRITSKVDCSATAIVGSERWSLDFIAHRLPPTTSPIEAEVIGLLPPAEFVVPEPNESSAPSHEP